MKKKEINTKLDVYGLDGKAVDTIQLDKNLFNGKVNKTLLYEANKMYEANVRLIQNHDQMIGSLVNRVLRQ